MPSAVSDLEGRLDEVRILLEQDPMRHGDNTNPGLSGALSRAAIVLLSAHLEGFLEDVVIDALDALVGHEASVEDLPLLLRAVHTEEHLRKLEPISDRNARAPRIEDLFQSESALWASGGILAPTMVRHSTVCGEMDNPSSSKIRQFLELVGVDIAAHLAANGTDELLGQIDGLVGRRNAIAHGEATVMVTYVDVDVYIDVVDKLTAEIAIAVAQSVQKVCQLAAAPW